MGSNGDNNHRTGCEPPHYVVIDVPISLPAATVKPLLHSIVRDEQKNLYISDEVNNCVISISSGGVLRWSRGGKGKGEGQFFYPRGIALGWIEIGKEPTQCLAVCDAWNNRIQFFDPEGHFLASWQAGGERAFQEVSDIRYFGADRKASGGCWLILDRGNNRLCVLASNGHLEFELGRAFPPNLESQWKKLGLEPADDRVPLGIAHDFSVFDPLYYPVRILGHSFAALYLADPANGRLKQAFLGSLFPLPIYPPRDSEWIAAAADVFLAYNKSTEKLSWLGCAGDVTNEIRVSGRPIGSECAVNEMWLHRGQRLELWHFDIDAELTASLSGGVAFKTLLNAAASEIEKIDVNASDNIIGNLLDVSQTCEEYLSNKASSALDTEALESLRKRAASQWEQAFQIPFKNRSMHQLWLASLKLRLISQSCSLPDVLLRLEALQTKFEAAVEPVSRSLLEAVQCRDRIALQRLELECSGLEDTLKATSILTDLESYLLGVIRTLKLWSGTQYCSKALVELPTLSQPGDSDRHYDIRWIQQPRALPGAPSSRYLREMEPFLLTASASEIQSNPRCIARTSNGHFFVTMHTRGSVIQLDARGKFVNEIFAPGTKIAALAKPEGLAADEKDRLWIVESGTNNIVIYDPQTDGLSARVPGKTQQSFLSNPVGIIPGPDKSMLVADRKNNRIVGVWENGTAKAFCGHSGSGPGELLQPLGLCIASRNQEDGFWVVDERNHRLQKFDFSARYIQRIGKCGPGKGSFLMPQFVAQFPDGILVVSQNQADCNLKVFSPDGIELDCMFLDYVPAGLLVSDRMLFVAEWSGQSIRVYERIGDSTAELKNSSKP